MSHHGPPGHDATHLPENPGIGPGSSSMRKFSIRKRNHPPARSDQARRDGVRSHQFWQTNIIPEHISKPLQRTSRAPRADAAQPRQNGRIFVKQWRAGHSLRHRSAHQADLWAMYTCASHARRIADDEASLRFCGTARQLRFQRTCPTDAAIAEFHSLPHKLIFSFRQEYFLSYAYENA